ncbi:MAG TPA: hypothetical protein VIG91_02585 [Terriglobales bacterium]
MRIINGGTGAACSSTFEEIPVRVCASAGKHGVLRLRSGWQGWAVEHVIR